MGEVDRGHVEVFQKLWSLRPYDKPNDDITITARLVASYQKVRKETEEWRDYKKPTIEILDFPLIQRMLLGADSVVHTPRLRALETNEKRMAKFSESMDACFIGRNAAVLQYTQFAYVDESTRRRMSNAATPKPGRFEKEWNKLDLEPTAMRGKADLQEAALIVTNGRPELAITAKLLTRSAIAPFSCEKIVIKHGEKRTGQQAS